MPANFLDELFYPGNTVQLEFRPDFVHKTVILTAVVNITDDVLQLALPLDRNQYFTPIKIGTCLTLSTREKNSTKIYYYTTELLEHHEGNPSILTLKRPTFIQNTSRRNFFRCDVDLIFYYWLEENCYRGQVINLSASGLYGIIETNRQLNPGGILPLKILLPSLEEPLSIEAKIIRIVKTDKSGYSGIALHYHNPTEKIQTLFTKYLFQRQRELIQEGRIKIGQIK
jgi:c-di-GMP-binding flagellar brake protein YcgR